MFKIADISVAHLTHDSRTVKQGSCFFVLNTKSANGKMYIKQAVSRGASIIVAEEKLDEPIPTLVVPDVREFMSRAAKRFYGACCDKMDIIGITGTNGKTTCAHMLKHILGKHTEIIGTLGPGKLTTPDPIELHEIFADMYRRGVRTVIMEVSAHAIHFRKIAGINFRTGIFTNLSQDHLDFFGTIDKYAQTKIDFMTSPAVHAVIVNIDDKYGREIIATHKYSFKYSIHSVKDLQLTPNGSMFEFEKHRFMVNMAGRFNVYNALACIQTARELGIKWGKVNKALRTLPPVPGRFSVIPCKGFSVIIDYAHTPDGLEKILTSCREFCAKRLIVVFGCGGNRDKTKREIMGAIAAKFSDYVVVTSDNPRYESPMAIMLQIEAGVKTVDKKYKLIEDRAEAVRHALGYAKEGDVVVIAGKGAETTQEIAGVFIPYTDEQIVREYI